MLREPSVIALDKNSGKVLQVGAAARSMLGRTPGNVVAVHPLQDGVLSDYELTARMLTEMLRRVLRHAIVKPRMIVTVPSGITEVEERAVIQAAMEAGARRVYLIEAPLAAALGAQLDITAPEGRMVVDIGGGTTDIGVLTMNGLSLIHIFAAASQPGGVVTNGMSYAARGGANANSALLASVTPEDFPEPGPLGGMLWQEQIEQACFRLGGADYHAPAQLLEMCIRDRFCGQAWKTG